VALGGQSDYCLVVGKREYAAYPSCQVAGQARLQL
jgi:hypothetical protein